ncbi:hypothetical protein [Streptomyces rhizosphaericus]|uniref:hypothetical protein n=1 Tax=Streptomyces rhizosphaericus TaxID=114699 RepID=UPI0036280580
MTDELDLLREANPVSADTGPWRDRPLDARAELLLGRLPSRDRRRRTVRRRAIWSLGAAAAATVVALALTVSGTGSSPAVAAPRPLPLVAHASRADVSLAEIVRRARAAAEESPGKSERGSHYQSWALSMKSGEDAVTLPREWLTRWNADGSGSTLEVATDPRHPGRPVIEDGPPPRTVHDGKVLSEAHYPPGINGANQSYFEDPRPVPPRCASISPSGPRAPTATRKSCSRPSEPSARCGSRDRASGRTSSRCSPGSRGSARRARSPTGSAGRDRDSGSPAPPGAVI